MRSMLYVLVLFATSAALAQGPSVKAPYALTISAPETSIVVGKPVEVQITLENTSDRDLTILKSRYSGELTYDVGVVTATGAPVTLTPYGRALHGLPNNPPVIVRNSNDTRTLKPHEKIVDTILLNKIYDLTSGSYIVRVQKVPKPNPEPNVVSNTLKLTILPD